MMVSRFKRLVVITALAMLAFAALAEARQVHYFDCKNCHRMGITFTDLGAATTNVCLRCHKDLPQSWPLNDATTATPTGLFAVTDASDAMGSYPEGLPPGERTSHMWAASDVNPAAGASAPVDRRFYSRYGITTGKVSCSRCHNPHDHQESNPKLLKLGAGSADAMCLDCHRSWDQSNNHGLETHPMVADYATVAAANPDKFKPAPDNFGTNGDVILTDGNRVSCPSCHEVHFADSDSSTVDGKGQVLNHGDGKLLRADGPEGADKSALCQACHTYLEHGDASGEKVGCLVCHSGHSYDPLTPNFFVLRKEATTTTFNTVSGLDYDDLAVLDAGQKYTFWNDRTDGTADGFCEKCHGDAKDIGAGAGDYHVRTAVCTDCHSHNRAGGSFSFEGSCNACHANPPVWGSHQAHTTEGQLLASLTCAACHQSSQHLNGLSEVRFAGDDTRLAGASYTGTEPSRYTVADGYGASPAYGSCDNLYCHSNAAPFDGVTLYRDPTWGGAAQSCASCHDAGGSATTLSGRHGKHTDNASYGFDCSRCHADTVADSNTVRDNTRHIDQVKDVVFAAAGSFEADTRSCNSTYCHSDGRGGSPNQAVKWSDTGSIGCVGCHNGRIGDASQMESNAHSRLANDQWIRQYPCEYCHNDTVDASGQIKDFSKHLNGTRDIVFDPQWAITGKPAPSYDSATMACDNLYCHSDGTTVNPEVRAFPWDSGMRAECNSCHGHPAGECGECHVDDGITGWSPEDQWKSAMPMYANTGPGTERANTHLRHLQTDFSCENCHANTVVGSCGTSGCHDGGVPAGDMTEVGHIDADFHVNRVKDVVFKDGGTYDPVTKRCSNTACHTGSDPQWGDSRNSEVLCLTCHGTTESDVDDFGSFNGIRAKINMNEWVTSGHGRPEASGDYTSGNPPANFPGNPCWYCHDNEVLHKDETNPFRLKKHEQFNARFDKECAFCHMEGTDNECLGCHNEPGSLAPQLSALSSPPYAVNHTGFSDGQTTCLTAGCHADDASRHKSGAGLWSTEEKNDVKNQYVMMGVCLQCHDDDSNGRCTDCHTGGQYELGFDPGTGHIAGTTKATSTHFGYKHYAAFEDSGGFADIDGDGKFDGTWRGGKFCWDCHDPHGDSNIYMIQDEVATATDGTFGVPVSRGEVSFTKKQSGLDYARTSAPYDGICNVCHQEMGQHYRFDYGDGHNAGRICTSCHEHRFSDSHASGQTCNTCHANKPIPRHTGFGLPRDCTKCHSGVIKKRMDIMGQFRGKSHHVQGVETTNDHCYACHWEATDQGLIDVDYHEGYNYKTYVGTPNAKADLVIWGPGVRPTEYQEGVTGVSFTAADVGTANERAEVSNVSQHCLGCHSDQNNDTVPFDDCKTPRQYAWDRNSIAARYSQVGTTTWGKYSGTANAAQKNAQKAFSAHGNATANEGGWSATTGEDAALPNTRNGALNVQCFDCHSSHGSNTAGVTSGYVTFDGTQNGGNLKETQAGKGGYGMTYKAQATTGGVNPMNAGAAQCFDCHETRNAGEKPWGFESTFGASEPVVGYRDSSRFGDGEKGTQFRFPFKASRINMGGHLQASAPLTNQAEGTINGLCTPCHDPHGVSPSLGDDQAYAVPMLKGTWMTSPFKEDYPQQGVVTKNTSNNVQIDRRTFGAARIGEDDTKFAGLCLRCHPKQNLTDGTNKNTPFKDLDRVHETVKGWGNNAEHSYSCSKCHQPHSSGLGKLMRTNCLDANHRDQVETGGAPGHRNATQSYPRMNNQWPACHESMTGAWNNQRWNEVTPW